MNYKLTSDKTDISAADGLIWTLVNRQTGGAGGGLRGSEPAWTPENLKMKF